MSTIYTDGHSMEVTAEQAAHLRVKGLIEPHPGAGSDGIEATDYRLTPEAEWDDVIDALVVR